MLQQVKGSCTTPTRTGFFRAWRRFEIETLERCLKDRFPGSIVNSENELNLVARPNLVRTGRRGISFRLLCWGGPVDDVSFVNLPQPIYITWRVSSRFGDER
jgi:hypothetical protein